MDGCDDAETVISGHLRGAVCKVDLLYRLSMIFSHFRGGHE